MFGMGTNGERKHVCATGVCVHIRENTDTNLHARKYVRFHDDGADAPESWVVCGPCFELCLSVAKVDA